MATKNIGFLDLASRTTYRALAPAASGALTINEDDMRAELIEFRDTNVPAAAFDANFPWLGTDDKGYRVRIKNRSGQAAQIQAATNAAGSTWTVGAPCPDGGDATFQWTGTDFVQVTDTAAQKAVRVNFRNNPVTAKLAGGAATGTAGDTNLLSVPGAGFEYHIKGTQTILAPVITATGLDVGMDQTANDGVELTNGILAISPVAFVVGTDGPFEFSVRFKIADVSGTDDCAIGFREAEAYAANIDDYTDMACLNVISGNITIETILNNAATVSTDTTNNWADGETHTLTVKVGADGAVTYEIDGAAPLTVAAYSFTAALVVVPFFFFLHDTDVAGAVEIISWNVG